MSRVGLGISGGVDSAVAIHLLQKAGHEVIGIHLILSTDTPQTQQALADARAMAEMFHIPLKMCDERLRFETQIIAPFVEAYRAGQTPNPCVRCNALIKFGRLWELAQSFGCSHLATGHYVRLKRTEKGHPLLCQGADLGKDQSYFLYALPRDILPKVLFPLGELTKEEVRALARELNLPVASKGDSQEICFIPENDYIRFLEGRPNTFPQEQGNFIDTQGKVLGQHKGIHRYTIGQRKGLGLALGFPAYVTHLDPITQDVTVGTNENLWRQELTARDCHFHCDAKEGRALVKIRSRDKGQTGSWQFDGGTLRVRFDAPVRAITPGQSVVLYKEQCVIGGGIISV